MIASPAFLIAIVVLASSAAFPADAPRSQHFDRDPGWKAHNNRIEFKVWPVVRQDFGYSATMFASKAAGEVGGRVQRTTKPAMYAVKIAPKTLDDPLSASGTFAITKSQASAGVFFGWLNGRQPGGSGRPIGSLGLHLDFESSGGRLAVRLLTGENQGCGTFITKYEQYRKPELKMEMRPTQLKADGTRYHWRIDYDPAANDGHGAFRFALDSDRGGKQDFEGRTFTVPVPAGYKQQGTRFDHFGLMNMMKAGGTATIHFGDIELDGQPLDLSRDPAWTALGNHASYEDREQTGAHNFGFSPTNHAGGRVGEIGGDFWRSGAYGYYADSVGPLDLNQRLAARGRATMLVGGPDADMMFGWFSSVHRDKSPFDTSDFIGIAIGGPTNIGHCFRPAFVTSRGTKLQMNHGPVLKPGRSYEWSLEYDPAANGGLGELTATLGTETVKLPFKPGRKSEGAALDRFGMFTSQTGGQMVRIYLDDLSYTTAPAR